MTTLRNVSVTARYAPSVSGIAEGEWDACHPGRPASWAYFRGVEAAPPPGFALGAICAERDGAVVAVVPVFITEYRLDTAFQSSGQVFLRRASDVLYKHARRLVALQLIGLGSPLLDDVYLGFAPTLTDDDRCEALGEILKCLARVGRQKGCQLLTAKGLSSLQYEAFSSVFASSGFTPVTTLPDVRLELPFSSIDEYLSSLPKDHASYLRRKWRQSPALKIETRHDIAGLETEINRLYAETIAQSKVDYGHFSQLHPNYFETVSGLMGQRAIFKLFWIDGELASFAMTICSADEIFAAAIGMRYPLARIHSLYFINWREAIDFAISNRIPAISMSGTTYATKLLFGGSLDRRYAPIRLSWGVANSVLPYLAHQFDFESSDPELRQIASKAAAAGRRDSPQIAAFAARPEKPHTV